MPERESSEHEYEQCPICGDLVLAWMLPRHTKRHEAPEPYYHEDTVAALHRGICDETDD